MSGKRRRGKAGAGILDRMNGINRMEGARPERATSGAFSEMSWPKKLSMERRQPKEIAA